MTSPALRVARAVKGWSRAELARVASVRVVSLASYESGERAPSRANLERIRIALMGELERAESFYGPVPTRERGRPRILA